MLVLDPGHLFDLAQLDVDQENYNPTEDAVQLRFVKREGPGYPGNVGHHAGTTVQEVCRALISRIKYCENQIPDYRNIHALNYLRQVIWVLEARAMERHGLKGMVCLKIEEIEHQPTCPKCGHIFRHDFTHPGENR